MHTHLTGSLCVLNQWALDFAGNTERIIQSIKLSKKAGACYRLGPELELCGYNCEDHFLEPDTYAHSWECLACILRETECNPELQNIVCDIGMPVVFSGSFYNCRVIILNGNILLIRPKMVLADDGVHRESRWFTAWTRRMHFVDYVVPSIIHKYTKSAQASTPFGDALLRFVGGVASSDVVFGLETCEELWTENPPHLKMYAAGAHIVVNANASHHELRKLEKRVHLVRKASEAGKGVYAYTNLLGCDGERVCYDGGAIVAVSGNLLLLSKRFGFKEVQVDTFTVDLNSMHSNASDMGTTSADASSSMLNYPVLKVPFPVCCEAPRPQEVERSISLPLTPTFMKLEDEVAAGPSLWLWDMLRRSKSAGFFLCLSGGLDSASVACLVFNLCKQLRNAITEGDTAVLNTCCSIFNETESRVRRFTARDFCSRLLYTCYMPSEQSSVDTASRASRLADAIGSSHLKGDIRAIVSSMVASAVDGLQMPKPPRFTMDGGTHSESLALQNVQARSRLVLAYLFAQLLPSQHGLSGQLLVLGAANLDECLLGYCTKYDCSSADLNPVGGLSKTDLRSFVDHCIQTLGDCLEPHYRLLLQSVLEEIRVALPTAELLPQMPDGSIQQDEVDMGLTYNMLSTFGCLRKVHRCGPYTMLEILLDGGWMQLKDDLPWKCADGDHSPNARLARFLADKVKLFFFRYATNRHKATILPPAYHTECYSADDNRYDLRPFLYPADWSHQFSRIDDLVNDWESNF